MPYRDESKLMSQDAPADASTEFRFDPPNGPFDGKSKESTVVGTLTSKYDVDWIAVELTAGKEYTISLEGMGDAHGHQSQAPVFKRRRDYGVG